MDTPSYNELMKKKLNRGLTVSEANASIINRIPNKKVTAAAFGLRIGGIVVILVDVGYSAAEVYTAKGWDEKIKIAISETARISGTAGGAWAGGRVGVTFGSYFGPWGGVIGGVGGSVVGGFIGGITVQTLIDALLYEFFPPNELDIEIFDLLTE